MDNYIVSVIGFSEWIKDELNKRNMSQADLSRSSGLSIAQISHVVNMQSPPGQKALEAIARAFGYPPEQVYRAAGLLPQLLPEDATFEDWKFVLNQLPEEDRQELLEFARLKLKRQQQEQERQRIRKFRPSEG